MTTITLNPYAEFTFKPSIKTDQDAFDAVTSYLASKSNGRAVEPGTGKCRYYVPSTNDRCAIGHLIDTPTQDALNVLARLACSVETLAVRSAEFYNSGSDRIGKAHLDAGGIDPQLLNLLQDTHDRGHHWTGNQLNANGFAQLRIIAQKHGLNEARLNEAMEARIGW